MAGVRWLFIACLGMLTAEAHAFIGPPVVVPASPTAATPITIEIRNGLCDALLSYSITNALNPTEVLIRRIPTQQDPLCINPIRTAEIPIGTLPAGAHLIRLFFQIRESIGQPPNPPYLWQELSVTVAPTGNPEPTAVPAMQEWMTICFMALLVGFVAWRRWSATMFSVLACVVLAAWAAWIPSPVAAATHIEVLLSANLANEHAVQASRLDAESGAPVHDGNLAQLAVGLLRRHRLKHGQPRFPARDRCQRSAITQSCRLQVFRPRGLHLPTVRPGTRLYSFGG